MPQTRQVTACPTRSCTRTAPSACGRITVSPVTRIIFTRYDRHGRLTKKTDLIPDRGYPQMMSGITGTITTVIPAGALHADTICRAAGRKSLSLRPAGPQVAKRVWRRERDLTGWMSLSRKPQVTWYGWGRRPADHDNDRSRIQTIYQPGASRLIRVETATGELARTQRRSLADALQQSGGE